MLFVGAHVADELRQGQGATEMPNASSSSRPDLSSFTAPGRV
jgi:hypothetical protein